MARTNNDKPKRTLDTPAAYGGREQDLIKAVGHRDRRRILRVLHEAREARSPNEIAGTISETVGHVSYHFKVLRECGVVTLTDTRPARGAMEHFYSSTVANNKLVRSALVMTESEDNED